MDKAVWISPWKEIDLHEKRIEENVMGKRKPKIGRPKGSGQDGTTVSFRLWPDHMAAVARWAEVGECTRSEAIRQMIHFAASKS